jgi:signal transduction histidine kinase
VRRYIGARTAWKLCAVALRDGDSERQGEMSNNGVVIRSCPVSVETSPKPVDTEAAISADIATIGRISAVPSILRLICQDTGMGFAAVARVSDETWTACAVQDEVNFGLKPGGQLDLKTTLCFESRMARAAVVIDHFSEDSVYASHHTPRIYKLQSYISVPIILPDGSYFGNLCAIDARPAQVSNPRTLRMFEVFANLIALQFEGESRHQEVEARLLDERATSELREQFIAVLGHDLRNPLAAVGATAELLSLRKNDPQLATLGQRLRATTFRMSRLIDDVMDFARGRLGSGIGVSIVPTEHLGVSLREVVAELQTANGDRTILVDISIDRLVYCDRTRIQQLLSNLLGNALTHGAPGQPVTVGATIQDDRLILKVRNGGDLISPDSISKVFEPYWRPQTSKPGGGLGLGLFICKQIVKAHGGDLEVQSSEAAGTVFTARIPCSTWNAAALNGPA